ncbi:glycosyl hydrolase [Sphingobium agri]|uniref:Glycoside hydrolase n=1 Tax=Sphingobium agri TaxID=2933566 RepID=A0ABT0E0R9_9SPHN|nr:glycosyl hydrolase [Sphingobium agri]MCK0532974.1 glycoside hydrolase [Sphingobium agri]
MKRFSQMKLGSCALVLALLYSGGVSAQDIAIDAFQTPPAAAKPRVWWHWNSGQISKAGIDADLSWMQRIGLGGYQAFDVDVGAPRVIEAPLKYMSPEWKDAFKYAVDGSIARKLDIGVAGSPGWSESGGPWVKPEQAMKKYVWTETRIEGGKRFTGKLAQPPGTAGLFQNNASIDPRNSTPFYRDSKVVAFRLPAQYALPRPVATASGGDFHVEQMMDGDVVLTTELTAATLGGDSWVQYDYGRPVTVRAITIATGGYAPMGGAGGAGLGPNVRLEASDDGRAWKMVSNLESAGPQRTTSVPATTARMFRIVVPAAARQEDKKDAILNVGGGPGGKLLISELVLQGAPMINAWEKKAGFEVSHDYYALATPAGRSAVRAADVLDLTSNLRPDGSLDWTAPRGEWVVLRFGYSLTGQHNAPAQESGAGLEVDKLNGADVSSYITQYLDKYRDASGGRLGPSGVSNMIFDSWEAGTANWTPAMLEQFKRLRGYDAVSYLPALAGYVVDSAENSDRFLWDFRRTQQELLKTEHYDRLSAELHKVGMIRYGESHEGSPHVIGDGMEMKASADVPMAALWVRGAPGEFQARPFADIRESASVAHIWGQNLVAAESLTAAGAPWSLSPRVLKPYADLLMLAGVNRFILHSSVHQPLMGKAPGLVLGPFGHWFNRKDTWAEQAGPWISYLGRASHLLQQGQAVNDVAIFYGEGTSIVALFGDKPPAIPEGLQYDYVNADALKNRIRVKDGRLMTENGMSWRLLYMSGQVQWVTLPTLERLRDLVRAGAVLVGERPLGSPSLSDDPAKARAIIAELWPSTTGVARIGAGTVYAARLPDAALAGEKIAADFELIQGADAEVRFLHRHVGGSDIYFVANRKDRAQTVQASFRTAGKAPELWDPVTGKASPASYRTENGRTIVDIPFDPFGATFVVFQKKGSEAGAVPAVTTEQLADMSDGWSVAFQPGRGAPAKLALGKLRDLSKESDPGVRYFSGTASYTRSLNIPKSWLNGARSIKLDLGQVEVIAEVLVNGRSAGIAWTKPYQIDIAPLLKQGRNKIEVRTSNLWVNRVVGDRQPGVTKRISFTAEDAPSLGFKQPVTVFDTIGAGGKAFGATPYDADTPLPSSGLIGPVRLIRENIADGS